MDLEESIYKLIHNDSRFKYIKNDNRLYALENIYNGLLSLYENNNEDIATVIDGDDWLSDEHSLQKVIDIYVNSNCMLTHGSWNTNPDGFKDSSTNSEYAKKIIDKSDFRFCAWKCSQLRTFKYSLFKNILKKDLLNSDGSFFKTTYDLALMFPMMEMAPNRIQFIKDDLYIYNILNELNDYKVHRKEQLHIEKIIRSKKKYSKLFD